MGGRGAKWKAGKGDYRISTPNRYKPNHVIIVRDNRGSVKQMRFFDKNGKAKNDIDFTNHGSPKRHSNPHAHDWNSGIKNDGSRELTKKEMKIYKKKVRSKKYYG